MSDLVLEKTATVANLLAAYEGESNAHAKYVLFAAKADAEGWHGAASLFRAAARAGGNPRQQSRPRPQAAWC